MSNGKTVLEVKGKDRPLPRADLTQMSRSLFSESTYSGQGFGLGFGINLDPAKALLPGSRGEYYWGGMFSTAFFIDPVERFFVDCLVLDPQHPETSARRLGLLARLRELLTRDFDIRELAGSAGRRG